MSYVIGISGYATVGKTTLARALLSRLSEAACLLPFASPLKDMLITLGVPPNNIYGDAKAEPLDLLCGRSGREAMQSLGTDWGRNCIGNDLWVNAWCSKAVELVSNDTIVITDDVRFYNEAQAVSRLGGINLRVVDTRIKAGSHPSETALDNYAFDKYVPSLGNGFPTETVEAILEHCYAYRGRPILPRR